MRIWQKEDIPEYLQKYFVAAEIGLEQSPQEYVDRLERRAISSQ